MSETYYFVYAAYVLLGIVVSGIIGFMVYDRYNTPSLEEVKRENTVDLSTMFKAIEYFKTRRDRAAGKWFLFDRNIPYGTTLALAVGAIHGHYWKTEGIFEILPDLPDGVIRPRDRKETVPFKSLHSAIESGHKTYPTSFTAVPHAQLMEKRLAIHIHLGSTTLSARSIIQLRSYWEHADQPATLIGVMYAHPFEQNLTSRVQCYLNSERARRGYPMGDPKVIAFSFTDPNNEVSVSLSPEVDVDTAFSAGQSFRRDGRARDPHFLHIQETIFPYRVKVV
jgi:hypothetical protein